MNFISISVADGLRGRDNNFNLLRLIAALMVIYSHSFPIALGAFKDKGEVFFDLTGITCGGLAVQAFFILSGLLVTNSLVRSRTLVKFAMARILRIYPGLLVCVILSALIVGPIISTVPVARYFSDPVTWKFIAINGFLASLTIQLPLPGVFESNPFPGAVNGSLWTLPWECLMYVSLALLGIAGLATRKRLIWFLWLSAMCVHVYAYTNRGNPYFWMPHRIELFCEFAPYFFAGVLLYLHRDSLQLNWITLLVWLAAMVATCAYIKNSPALIAVYVPVVAMTVINLALVPAGILRSYNRLGDYSYGTYIYAYPVQQMLVLLTGAALTPVSLFYGASAVTLLIAIVSWHFVEHPALSLKQRLLKRPSMSAASPDLSSGT